MATANSAYFDELYAYDGLHRLRTFQRGRLNGTKDGLTTLTFAQQWLLDTTGNWGSFEEDADGDTVWDLDQNRFNNPVNEITNITETTGPSWATPAYDRAGNMTTIPQPADPTKSYTATYDAWNRLVKIVDDPTSNTVAEYQYDGARRRNAKKTYDGSGTLQETRQFYYTDPDRWQVVEERVGTTPESVSAERRFIWGVRYIDDVIVRDRDSTHDGTLNERLYGMHDANWNVTSISNTVASIQERYSYTAYGEPSFSGSSFIGHPASLVGWETLYAGYRYDIESGLCRVRYRTLHAVVGTWLQRDPLGSAAGVNSHQYLSSDPVSETDPTGLICCDECAKSDAKCTAAASCNFLQCLHGLGLSFLPVGGEVAVCVLGCVVSLPNLPVYAACVTGCLGFWAIWNMSIVVACGRATDGAGAACRRSVDVCKRHCVVGVRCGDCWEDSDPHIWDIPPCVL